MTKEITLNIVNLEAVVEHWCEMHGMPLDASKALMYEIISAQKNND